MAEPLLTQLNRATAAAERYAEAVRNGLRSALAPSGQLDSAIPIAVLDVGPTENHQAGLELVGIEDVGHEEEVFLSRFCPDRGWKCLILHACPGLVQDIV